MMNCKQLKVLLFGLIAILGLSQVVNAESLYDEDTYQALVSDKRSEQVGQSLTVLIYEEATSSTSAGTDANRSTGFSASLDDGYTEKELGVGINSNTNGGGTINREGKLIARVTVTITKKLEHGEIEIAGEQLIEFNEEKQHIRLTGRVRKEDISAQNTILSTRIADAKITYVGDGLLGRRQKEGVLSRFFNWLF